MEQLTLIGVPTKFRMNFDKRSMGQDPKKWIKTGSLA